MDKVLAAGIDNEIAIFRDLVVDVSLTAQLPCASCIEVEYCE